MGKSKAWAKCMIKPLRKRHLQIWSVLAVLIPVGIVSAIIVRPKPVTNTLLQPTIAEALPIVIKTVEKENYTVSLRGNDQTPVQLEWINKSVLTFPTAVIYKTNGTFSPGHSDLIGRIEARGTYHFALKPDSTNNYRFILYDFIHQQKIDSIEFK
jgi:hypothetical protein